MITRRYLASIGNKNSKRDGDALLLVVDLLDYFDYPDHHQGHLDYLDDLGANVQQ